jgi:hypothetical protein
MQKNADSFSGSFLTDRHGWVQPWGWREAPDVYHEEIRYPEAGTVWGGDEGLREPWGGEEEEEEEVEEGEEGEAKGWGEIDALLRVYHWDYFITLSSNIAIAYVWDASVLLDESGRVHRAKRCVIACESLQSHAI